MNWTPPNKQHSLTNYLLFLIYTGLMTCAVILVAISRALYQLVEAAQK